MDCKILFVSSERTTCSKLVLNSSNFSSLSVKNDLSSSDYDRIEWLINFRINLSRADFLEVMCSESVYKRLMKIFFGGKTGTKRPG
jgi:hypothetical protein